MSAQEVRVDIIAQVKGDVQGQINKAKTSLGQLKQSTDQWQQSNQKATAEANKTATSMSKVGTASQGAATKVKTFGSSISTLVTGMAAAASGIVMMMRSYRDLEDTQIRVSTATNTLHGLENRLTTARNNTNKALQTYGKNSAQYQLALKKEKVAEAKVITQKQQLGEALEAQSDAYQDFYLSIIPTSLGIIGTLGTALSGLSKNSAGAAGGFSQMSAGSKLLKVGLTALPLVAIAAAFLAIRTNAFGVRDALNELGAKIGAAVPQLVPFLNWIKDLATALGLTGQALDLSKAWQLFVDGFKTAINALATFDWGTALQNLLNSAIDWIQEPQNWTDLGEAIIQAFEDAIEWTKDNVAPWLEDMSKKVIDWAKEPKNWEKLGKQILDAIVSAVKLQFTAWAKVAEMMKPYFDALVNWAKEPKNWVDLGTAIVNIIAEAVKLQWTAYAKIAEMMAPYITKLVTWAKDPKNWANLGKDIINAVALAAGVAWQGWNTVADMMKPHIEKLTTWAKDPKTWTDIGKAIVEGIWNAAKTSAVDVGSTGLMTAFKSLMQGGGVQTVFGEEQKGGSFLDTATANFDKIMAKTGGGGGATAGLPDEAKLKSLTATINALNIAFTTLSSAVTTTMTAINTQIGVMTTTTKTQFTTLTTAMTTLGTAFTTLGTTVSTAMTTLNTQIGVFATTTNTQFTALTTKITALGTTFTTLATTITTAMTTANTQVGVFATTTTTQFNAMATSVTTSITKMNTQVGVFTTTLKSQSTAISQSTTSISGSFLAMSSSIVSSLQKAISEMSKFVSSLKSVASQAAAAKKDVDALAKSINALKDKSITVHVGLSGPGVGYLQHGGSFFAAGQHGYSGIVNKPTTFKGVRMGEGFAPELVTVTPLVRGTGNHTGPTVGSGPLAGGGGDITIPITVVLDGRVIDQRIERVALSKVGMQI